MTRFLVPGRISADAFATFVADHGLDPWYAPPPTGGLRQVVVGDGDRFVRWATFATEGQQLLLCGDALADAVVASFDAVDLADALGSDDPVRTVGLAAAVARINGPAIARDTIVAHLDHADPIVRRFAGRFAWMLRAEGLPAVQAAAERHEDLAFAAQMLEHQVAEAAAGTLGDLPTTDSLVLSERAMEAALAGQLERARRAAEPLLEDQPYHREGLFALGVASAEANPLLAAFFLGAVADVRRYDDDALEFPDAAERLAALPEPTDDHRAASVDRVLHFLSEWERYASYELSGGAARAIRGRLPELDALSTFLADRGEPDAIAAAVALAPGVPWFRSQLARALDDVDPERADRERDALIEDLLRGIPQSPLEERIDAAVRGDRGSVTAASELRRRASAVYARKEYDRAVAYADRAIALDPNDSEAHQVRALVFTFSDRLAEAVDAYADTTAAMDRAYAAKDTILFNDPRPQMWFNRACCEARLGRREDALESLRRAVVGDEKYAESARTDDWLESLWEDPAFLGIAARDPEALVLAEHRTAAHALGLLSQAIDAENRGLPGEAAELAEQAATAAARAGEVAIRAEATSRRARSLAFAGHLDLALEAGEAAAAMAGDPAVPPRVRGEVFAQLGVVRQARRELGPAREAYLRSLDARQESGDALLEARSELTLSFLDLELGDTGAARARVDRVLPVLRAAIEAGAPAAAHDDLATAWIRRAAVAEAEGDAEVAVTSLQEAVAVLGRMADAGAPPLPGLVQSAAEAARRLGALEVAAAATALVSTGSPAEDRVRAVFRGLGLAVVGWRSEGTDDPTIAGWLGAALGGRPLPPEVEPLLRPFRTLFVELAARHATLLVTSTMAVELAATGLDRALGELCELWASAADV